jgi:hypothetical protein
VCIADPPSDRARHEIEDFPRIDLPRVAVDRLHCCREGVMLVGTELDDLAFFFL